MDVADYRPMAREYLIWNAAIASLQYLDTITLATATEEVY